MLLRELGGLGECPPEREMRGHGRRVRAPGAMRGRDVHARCAKFRKNMPVKEQVHHEVARLAVAAHDDHGRGSEIVNPSCGVPEVAVCSDAVSAEHLRFSHIRRHHPRQRQERRAQHLHPVIV